MKVTFIGIDKKRGDILNVCFPESITHDSYMQLVDVKNVTALEESEENIHITFSGHWVSIPRNDFIYMEVR